MPGARGVRHRGSAGPDAGGSALRFERYEVHTAWARSRGQRERSGPGDLDLVVLGARTWVRLVVKGDLAALLPLWVPDEHVLVLRGPGRELREQAHRFVSRAAGRAALGSLRSHWDRATVRRGRGRPGYVPRPAAHALRAGLQGLDLLRTGSLRLPVPEPDLSELCAVRAGTTPLREVRARVAEVEADLERACRTADVPAGPDRVWLQDWLSRSSAEFWRS